MIFNRKKKQIMALTYLVQMLIKHVAEADDKLERYEKELKELKANAQVRE